MSTNLIGPDEPGNEWAAIEAAVLAASGIEPNRTPVAGPAPAAVPAPANADESEADVDPEADSYLWPSVVDAKGRNTGELARPNPEAAKAAMRRAAAVSAADIQALAGAISEPEARDIIAQAASQRSVERELGAGVAKLRAQLAAEGARRQAEHEARMAEARRRRENRAAAALERRDRALDPTTRVVRLAAAERWVPWIATLPAFLAAGLGAVNVGVSLDVLSPGTQLINWMVEPLLTLPVVAILIAQILGAVGEGDANPYRSLERGLVFVALVLNVGLHIAVDGLTPAAFVWAIVPAGLAISANLVPRLIGHTRQALTAASAEPIPDVAPQAFRVTPQAGVQVDSDWTAPGPSQVNAGDAGESRSDAEVLADLAEAVRNRAIDPGTGRPIDPKSAESIRRTIGIAKARARCARDQYASIEATE
ncbi:hypothetical protein [Glycomyces terrestris]|uniref:DUF2637 domain-containing protein n=1 Tax=Glycomyces terrestris TaxID=2493553 RepID=A0A426URU7_9ACTN|nr:hypothetical protein [Glycomyces terrestris]RRR95553.1 hypothetical protein EIW28_23885 [Glycomyces terrestris]